MKCKECNGEGLLTANEAGMQMLCHDCKGTGQVDKIKCLACDKMSEAELCRNCAVTQSIIKYPDGGITLTPKSKLPQWAKDRGDVINITEKDIPLLRGETK